MPSNFLVGLMVAAVLAVAGIVLLLRRRRAGRALYRKRLLEAVADGVITNEEFAELEALRERHEISRAEARMAALAAYRRVLGAAVADAELSADEDATLQRLQQQLGLRTDDIRTDLTQLSRLRTMGRVAAGELPRVEAPGIQLVPDEHCHWIIRATLAERVALPSPEKAKLRAIEFDVDAVTPFDAAAPRDELRPSADILPHDLGVLAITSRRIIFKGAKRTVSTAHARLLKVALYADGVRFDEAQGANGGAERTLTRRFFLVDDAELTAAIALQAARIRRDEIRPATRPNRSA